MITDDTNQPPQYLQRLVEDTMGRKVVQWQVPDCGLSAAYRYSVQLEDQQKVFVKAATDEQTAQWLRTEQLVLSAVKSAWMPEVIAWMDEPGIHPVLISQDLSAAYWPASHKGVTWRSGDVELLFSGMEEMKLMKGPPELPLLKNKQLQIWTKIAAAPEKFLAFQLCSERWLKKNADSLISAANAVDETGDQLVHGDIRSDNVCFLDGQVLFVDWSHAARGNGRNDLATVLPTLYLEGGPAPYQVMPDGGSWAADQCAMHVSRLAGDEAMPRWLKTVFIKLVAIELEWAAACLGLEPPDGLSWHSL